MLKSSVYLHLHVDEASLGVMNSAEGKTEVFTFVFSHRENLASITIRRILRKKKKESEILDLKMWTRRPYFWLGQLSELFSPLLR